MSNIWFTADLHLGHLRLAEEFRQGPFEPNVEAHNEWLLTTLNERVGPFDDLYVLGDAFMGPKSAHESLFKALPGARKYLIRGNHDSSATAKFGWEWVRDLATFKNNKRSIVMSHFPFLSWEGMEWGRNHAHGHTHGDLQDDGVARRLDVGIDAVGQWAPEEFAWGPVPMEVLLDTFEQRPLPDFRHRR